MGIISFQLFLVLLVAACATKRGQINVISDVGVSGVLENVMFSPELPYNLLSVSKMEKAGYTIIFDQDGTSRITKDGEVIMKDGKRFRKDYSYHPAVEGWFKLHQIPATWQNARLRCCHEGAVLASPEERPVLDAMKSIISAAEMAGGIYTGISATYSKGYYHSVQGTPLTSFQHLLSWVPNEPNNKQNAEDCLIMLPNGSVADVACSEPQPFLCFRKNTTNIITNCGTVDINYSLDASLGSCYKFHPEPQSWSQAFATCSGEGGHLAVVNSDAEAQVLGDLYAKHPTIQYHIQDWAYVGANDWGEHGIWRTVHGQSLEEAGFNKWQAGEPNNASSLPENCVCFQRNAVLLDINCGTPLPFFCEKSPYSLVDDDQ